MFLMVPAHPGSPRSKGHKTVVVILYLMHYIFKVGKQKKYCNRTGKIFKGLRKCYYI